MLRTLLAGSFVAGVLVIAPVAVTDGPAAVATTSETGGSQCERTTTRYVKSPDALYSLNQIGVQSSWKLATGKGQTIAVVDSGVDDDNAHLEGVVTESRSFVGGSPSTDERGHGTLVAGVLAGRKIKQSVLVGAAPDARIVTARVMRSRTEELDTDEVAAGIRWAADQGVGVMNISISTGPSDPKLPALRSAIEYAIGQDVVVVASAGNQSEDTPLDQVQYPAGFPGVIGVAGADASGDVDDWSIHGDHVDVSAPGSNILATFYDAGDCLVGLDHPYTSYAAPFVSALAAQLRERFPDDTAAEIGNRILSTADRPRSSARDDEQGWGLIQPLAALSSTSNAAPGRSEDQVETANAADVQVEFGSPVDPAVANRERLLWWGLAMVAVLGVAMVARPLTAARRRR